MKTKKTKKYYFFFFPIEEKEYEFDEPELILTQDHAGKNKENAYLKHEITLSAIEKFLALNRKLFKEPDNYSNLVLDEDMVEKAEPFLLEEKLAELQDDNVALYDFVSAKCGVFAAKENAVSKSFLKKSLN